MITSEPDTIDILTINDTVIIEVDDPTEKTLLQIPISIDSARQMIEDLQDAILVAESYEEDV